MHFALPPRKTSNPPPYAVRNTRNSFSFSAFRRKRLQAVGLAALGALSILWLITSLLHDGIFSGNPRPPAGVPEVAIVTLIDDEGSSADYIEKIKQNRIDYAARHGKISSRINASLADMDFTTGYATFFPNMSDYALDSAPKTWAMIPALRHATTKFPQTQWLFSISQHALIMNPALSISSHITNPSRLSTLMKRDHPVVPPDSVIHTFSHLLPRQIDLIISQDGESLSHGSFLLRNWGGIDARGKREGGDWAKFFLDTWYNPLYRSYNFQKAEGHALVYSLNPLTKSYH
jgi:mannan polymerase II complex MNN11 subunit